MAVLIMMDEDRLLGWYGPGTVPTVTLGGDDPDWLQYGTSIHEQIHQALSVTTTFGHTQALLDKIGRHVGDEYLQESQQLLHDSSILTQEGAAALVELVQIATRYGDAVQRRRLDSLPADYIEAVRCYDWIVAVVKQSFFSDWVLQLAVIGVAQVVLSTPILDELSSTGLEPYVVGQHLQQARNRPDARLKMLGDVSKAEKSCLAAAIADAILPMRGLVHPHSTELAIPVERAILHWARKLNLFQIKEPVGYLEMFEAQLKDASVNTIPPDLLGDFRYPKLSPSTVTNIQREYLHAASPQKQPTKKPLNVEKIEPAQLTQWVLFHQREARQLGLIPNVFSALFSHREGLTHVCVVVTILSQEVVASTPSVDDTREPRLLVGVKASDRYSASCALYFDNLTTFIRDYKTQPNNYETITALGLDLVKAFSERETDSLSEALDGNLFIYEAIFSLDPFVGEKSALSGNSVCIFRDCDPLPNIVIMSSRSSPQTNLLWLASEGACYQIETALGRNNVISHARVPVNVWHAAWHCAFGVFALAQEGDEAADGQEAVGLSSKK